ncbi:methylated-DNA-[protein]-cysteine S-methyltransferase [Halopenitus malekzadehii]|uniref:Methylated-DNA-[protein]-cysteine S-methyltransferase n=1 Tax=Halopenitus malekzadehii TaxID=1267564 RepID=A0A1H6HUB8_9EURY|nr:methylated-DNA-[protein]-cysteine S-methyltransferase [Halopenitus malekzadehii]
MVSLGGTTGVYARSYPALDRAVEVGFASGHVISVSFPETVPEDAAQDHELLDRVDAYLAGEEESFTDVELGLTLPTDRREVLEATRNLPYGESASLSRLTRLAGRDDNDSEDLEFVREALSENPTPLLIPDHRVEGGPYATPGTVRGTFREIEELR